VSLETMPPVDPVHEPGANTGGIGQVVSAVRAVNRWLHFIAGLMLIAIMLMTMVDVIGRTAFNSPFRGTVELTQMAMVVVVYLGLGYAAHEDDHISVDVVDSQIGPRMRLAVAVFTGSFGAVVIGLLTWNLYRFAGRLDVGGYTTAVLRIPQGPVALVAVVGGVMLVLALIGTAALALRSLLKERR
jgi:TRAP-type C4-dicarboxylate transport system permease small subunit